jgi:DNA processing protein
LSKDIKSKDIKILTLYDEDYPKALKDVYDPPVVLYYRGTLLPEDENSFGVVGTRKITGYGEMITEKLTGDLVRLGFTIVSGLARGVDTIAHKTALSEGGRTIAVLGSGLNSIYPQQNISLAKQIEQNGAVVSEFPPDYPPMAENFPQRNRIISGLSKAILIPEAAEKSGSLITARLALEQGREVFAVPGPITSFQSKGTANLIKRALSGEKYHLYTSLATGPETVEPSPPPSTNTVTAICGLSAGAYDVYQA